MMHDIKCDNDNCDYILTGLEEEKVADYRNVNCPKCGENLLTDEDFKRFEAVMALHKALLLIQEAEGIESAEDADKYVMRVNTHKEISIESIEKQKKHKPDNP